MPTQTQKPRRIPTSTWRAARTYFIEVPTATLGDVAERFDLTLTAVNKHSSREKWSQRRGQGLLQPQSDSTPGEVSAEEFRKFLQTEAMAWLKHLRAARHATGYDLVEVAKSVGPIWEKVARLGARAFGLNEETFEPPLPPIPARPLQIAIADGLPPGLAGTPLNASQHD